MGEAAFWIAPLIVSMVGGFLAVVRGWEFFREWF
jgi:hypothetical protein